MINLINKICTKIFITFFQILDKYYKTISTKHKLMKHKLIFGHQISIGRMFPLLKIAGNVEKVGIISHDA